MKTKLNSREYVTVASMLFGMFFGAGNLIFPVHLGQMAGQNALPAIIGFTITAVGIPILGVAAIGVRQRPLQKIELIRRSLRLLPDSGRSHGAADDQQHQSAKRQHDPSFPHGSRPPSASGQRTMNTAPPPGALVAVTVPPRLCTVSCTMERPSPVPPAARERALSTR